jgi:hypothetical protein
MAAICSAENTVPQRGAILSFTTQPNEPPVFSGYASATPYQTAATIALRKLLAGVSDPDGDTFAVSAAGPVSANGGAVALQTAGVRCTPPAGFSGADTFPVTILDSRGASVTGIVTVTVGPGPAAGGAGVNPPVLTTLPDGRMGIAFRVGRDRDVIGRLKDRARGGSVGPPVRAWVSEVRRPAGASTSTRERQFSQDPCRTRHEHHRHHEE